MNKIAFLFLLYDIINHENIWFQFFNGISTNKYNIYIHYKSDDKLEFFNDYKLNINKTTSTKYADISIVKGSEYIDKRGIKR